MQRAIDTPFSRKGKSTYNCIDTSTCDSATLELILYLPEFLVKMKLSSLDRTATFSMKVSTLLQTIPTFLSNIYDTNIIAQK